MAGKTALVVGVGPGLGWALVRRLTAAGYAVAMAARVEGRLKALIASQPGTRVLTYACDATDPTAVERLFDGVEHDLGAPELVIFNAGVFEPGSILSIAAVDFERCWRVGCLGGFLVGQAAAKRMVAQGAGTIIFTGATASLRGSAGFVNLAVPKFGLRAVAQSMARELGPRGIHVAHVIIDGQILSERTRPLEEARGPDSLLKPEAIAEAYWQVHQQPRSAWTLELDLRPWSEKF